jgi:hypothetical protein
LDTAIQYSAISQQLTNKSTMVLNHNDSHTSVTDSNAVEKQYGLIAASLSLLLPIRITPSKPRDVSAQAIKERSDLVHTTAPLSTHHPLGARFALREVSHRSLYSKKSK